MPAGLSQITPSPQALFSKSDWKRSYHSEIWNVSGDTELGCDVEQGSSPHDGAEANVNGAQNSVRVRHHEICEVWVSKISNVEAGRD
jgi:hypothetical protein